MIRATALIGPIFCRFARQRLRQYAKSYSPLPPSGIFWVTGIVIAIQLSVFLREIGMVYAGFLYVLAFSAGTLLHVPDPNQRGA
jgi:hypothetical protein